MSGREESTEVNECKWLPSNRSLSQHQNASDGGGCHQQGLDVAGVIGAGSGMNEEPRNAQNLQYSPRALLGLAALILLWLCNWAGFYYMTGPGSLASPRGFCRRQYAGSV